MLAKAGADIATILDLTEDETGEVLQMTRLFELEELTELARIFAQNDLMQKNQGTPQLGLELAFLQSIELHRRTQSGQLPESTSTPSARQRSTSAQAQTRPVVSQVTSSAPSVPQETSLSSSSAPRQPASPKLNREIIESPPDLNGFSSMDESVEEPRQPLSRPEMPAPGQTSLPALPLQQVKDAWENVKKRVKPKDGSTAAMLNDYTVVAVEGTAEEAIVVIQATHDLHYNYVREKDRSKHVNWALSTEFRQKCHVRLLAPGQPVPAPPAYASNSHSANTAMPLASQQSAHLERRASTTPAPAGSKHVEQEGTPELVQRQEPAAPVVHTPGENSSSPVVKKSVLRENTTIESSSPEALKQKVSRDPVVQEVMKTFTAKIVDIRTK